MKKLSIFLFVLLSLAGKLILAQGERGVAWVHGFGGDATSWDAYDARFTSERCMLGISLKYIDSLGIDVFANEVIASTNSRPQLFPKSASPRAIGIGHSMGSIALRRTDMLDPANNRRFGGIITVGGPNNGLGLVNSFQAGQVTAFLSDATSKLGAGPTSQTPFSNPVVNNITRQGVIAATNTVFRIILSNTNLSTVSADQLKVGSTEINNINAYASQIPRISIVGSENAPAIWRIASSYSNNNSNDNSLVTTTNVMRGIYHVNHIVNISASITTIGVGFLNPAFWITTPVFAWRSAQWKKGRDWFDRSENLWNGLTRCHRWETTSFTTTYNPCIQFTTGTTPWINCLNTTCPGNWAGCFYPTTYNSTVFVRLPSDGLVCGDSQTLDDIPLSNVYPVIGVNHREENNTTNRAGGDIMRVTFDLIWTRTAPDFFRTKLKSEGC